ncbi:hypothetical protein SLEP1_g39341 [Rubroshorea leprosula]|nr:hypothetical protein SLEP1_g39341 [Rubroshorea leprosula]
MEFSSAKDAGEEEEDSTEKGFSRIPSLHATDRLVIVVAVVKKISIADTKIKYSVGKRALFCATKFGMIKTAQFLVRRTGNLLTVTDDDEISSNGWLVMACPLGHKEVAHYLYSVTPFNLPHLRSGHQEFNFLHLCQYTKYLLYGACLTTVYIIPLKYLRFGNDGYIIV